MSDRTLQAQITAVDKASPVFAQVAQGAQRMGAAVSTAAERSSQSLRDNKKAVDDLKIGTAALVGAFGLASRASQDQTRQIDAITRLYGESADAILKQSEAIQDNTRFSNDQARQAAITGSTLAQNYQLTAEQIGVLIQRSADLAQIHRIDLADAMTRVSGAIRGEGEAAELLGLNMSDSAVAAAAAAAGLKGWNTTMTEAEKAAFRYSLVLDQTTSTMGAAADAADTTAGKVRHLTNEVQDVAQNFAEWTGPVGEATASLSDNALEIAVVGGGLVKLASGLKEAGVASKVLSLALGPAGLVVAATAAGAAIYYLATQESDLERIHHATADASTSFANELAKLGATGNAAAADFAKVSEAFGQLLADQDALAEAARQAGGTGGVMDALAIGQINDIRDDILNLFNNPFVDASKVTDELLKLFAQFQAGEISADKLDDAVENMARGWSHYAKTADDAAKSTDTLVDHTDRLERAAARAAQRWQEYDAAVRQARQADIDKAKANRELLDSMSREATEERTRLERDTQKWTEYDDAVRAANDSRVQSTEDAQAYLDQLDREREKVEADRLALIEHADANNKLRPLIDANAEASRLQGQAFLEARQAALDAAHAFGIFDTLAKQLRPIDLAPRGGDRATGHAAIVQQLGGALDSVLGTFQTIDALGQRAEQAGSIAEDLVGSPGELATIDDLLKRGVISQTRYNMTVEAGYRIQQRQKSVEEDLNVIRAKQLPLLNEQDKAYAREIDKLSHLSAQEQQVALGFMDATEAGKAQQAVMLAAAAASGELGDAGEETATKIIEGAVAADPVLEEMLTSIGLVARDHEGNLVVNFPEGDNLNDLIKDLTGSIDALTRALGGVPPTTNADVNVNQNGLTESDIWGIAGALDAAAGVYNATLNVGANVSAAAQQAIDNFGLGGRNGGVLGYRDGGMVLAELAEDGPERVRFRDGGTAIVPHRGLYAVERGAYVTPTAGTMAGLGGGVTFQLNNYGPINGFSDLDDLMAEGIRIFKAKFAGLGA